MTITEEKTCLCAMGHIFGFDPGTAISLLNTFGSARELFNLPEKEADSLFGAYSKYKGRICRKEVDLAYEELSALSDKGYNFTGWGEDDYPALLKECEDAPCGIYIRSDTPPENLWNGRRFISIVGTRDLSPYGMEWCERLVHGIAQAGAEPVIVSGLALGTDICAHRAALKEELPTIGVMATGPETVYPSRHSLIAEKISRTEGCALITDFPPGTPPLPIHFLRRNRIIAGLSEAVILTESKSRGGGMNTARLAFSYNRSVFAFPGRLDDLKSQGCNMLIKEKIAEPLVDVEGFITDLSLSGVKKVRKSKSGGLQIDRLREIYGDSNGGQIEKMSEILEHVRRARGITIGELCDETGYGYSTVAGLVSMLEAEGLICVDILQRCTININL
ncbi:MAG: DNA-protecting protein DprA [Bacteroidales bacterium]|nr:DNA-protecting protein DprA [Bacteroidales bacterium]